MRIERVVVLGALLVSVSGVAAWADEVPQPFPNAKVTTLLKTVLAKEFTPDREVLMDVVEMPPNTTLERHWHPGEEFHYYLEGEVEIRIDGQEPYIGKAGTVGHIPFKKLHTAATGKVGAKMLVVRVHTKGEPMRYLENEGKGGK
jgi:quercetin dioxygenase-like cupin family protein